MNEDVQSIQADRPNIITTEIEAISFYRKMDTKAIVSQILAGRYVLVEEFYSNGLEILNELKKTLLLRHQDKSFQGKRDFRSEFKKASHKLLLKVENNKLVVKKSPDIGWLTILYPDVSDFYISFLDIQGMNSSWQWHENGIEIKTLDLTLKPYYGTYFPTRFDHLKLSDKWLKKADLIVFNPPWLPAKHKLEEGIDKAMYCDKELFPRFFKQAKKHLAPDGKIVLNDSRDNKKVELWVLGVKKMKKLFLLALASSLLTTTYASAEWIKPTRKACTKNGGRLAPGGICMAPWSSAKKICIVAGARLPSIGELKEVITSCGGEVDDFENNKNDPDYQSCYKKKGFSRSANYWSSTSYESATSHAWGLFFHNGNDYWYDKSSNGFVRCMKDEQ